MVGTYKIEEFSLGHKQEGDKIVFSSVADLEEAYRDIDNGKNIYIEKDGIVTKLLHQMISGKVYDGTLVLSAKKRGNEKVGEEPEKNKEVK